MKQLSSLVYNHGIGRRTHLRRQIRRLDGSVHGHRPMTMSVTVATTPKKISPMPSFISSEKYNKNAKIKPTSSTVTDNSTVKTMHLDL